MTSSPPQFDRLLSQILAELGEFQVLLVPGGSDPEGDVRVVGPAGADFRLEVKEYKRITPATAGEDAVQFQRAAYEDAAELFRRLDAI